MIVRIPAATTTTTTNRESSTPVESAKQSFRTENHAEEDGFLVDATEDHDDFQSAKSQLRALGTRRGDKSKGFQSQSQRPGEFKKRRTRY